MHVWDHSKLWGVSQAYTTSLCWWWALLLIYTVSDLVIHPMVLRVFLGQFTTASCRDWTLAVLRIPLLSSHLHHFQSPSPPAYDPSDHCLTIDYWVNVWEATASYLNIYPPFSCPVSQLELKNHAFAHHAPSFYLISYYFIPFLWLENFKNYIKIWPTDHIEGVEITPQVFTLCQSHLAISVSYCYLKSSFTLAYIKKFLILSGSVSLQQTDAIVLAKHIPTN